jgi:hypothetical protein
MRARWQELRDAESGVRQGNKTRALTSQCYGKAFCTFEVNTQRLGDPTNGCEKDSSFAYQCEPNQTFTAVKAPAPADGRWIMLSYQPVIDALEGAKFSKEIGPRSPTDLPSIVDRNSFDLATT